MQAVFVHGAGGGSWEWNVWRRVFEAHGIATVAPELQPGPEGLMATGFADYLAQLRAAATVPPAPRVLAGASLGGLLALAAAAEVGASALLLVNPLPPAPLQHMLPRRGPYPPIVPWGRDAGLAGTRDALPDADAATCLYAFRRWRDESGRVLEQARGGIAVEPPECPLLVMASADDDEVPATVSEAVAARFGATLLRLPAASHVGPLLGSDAAAHALKAVAWLNAAPGLRTGSIVAA